MIKLQRKQINSLVNKIVYLTEFPYIVTERDNARLGIDILKETGVNVEVWDLTTILHKEISRNIESYNDIIKNDYKIFLDRSSLVKEIHNLSKNDVAVMLVSLTLNSCFVYRSLSKKNIKFWNCLANAKPEDENDLNKSKKAYKRIINVTPKKIFNYLFNKIPFNCIGINSPCLFVAGGEKTINLHRKLVNEKSEILWAHQFDYDLFLNDNASAVVTDDKLCIFLDEYEPFHPDLKLHGIKPAATAQNYFPLLCNFFDYLEEKFSYRVIIAAHPRSRYEEHPDYFEGRECIRGKTAELVRKSSFVMTHCSTSVSFAILYNKPIIYITTDEINNGYLGPNIYKAASYFQKEPININNYSDFKLEKELIVSDVLYKKYKNDYIKKASSENIPCWQIFANYIMQKHE